MVRLNLLLADFDEGYLSKLADYLQNRHSTNFSVSYVTGETNLKVYLEKHRDTLDILLVCPGMAKGLYTGTQTTVVLLSDGRLDQAGEEYLVIDKYQRGDQLASRIIQIYLEEHPDRRFVNTSQASSRLVAVYSPSGGCGKSSLAAGLSALANQQGKKAMYLNLEGCESTEAWFEYGNSPSISELFYHLKEGAKQLSLKLEALSYRDPATRVRSFTPAESLLDFNELNNEDLETLADELRRTGDIDVVFIDLSASVDPKNLKILELVDNILMVVGDEAPSQAKMRSFLKQIPMLERKRNVDYSTRSVLVCNSRSGGSFGEFSAERFKGVCTLPNDRSLLQGRVIADRLSGSFGRALHDVWNALEL